MVYSRWSSGYFHSCSFDMCNNLVGYEFSCPTVLFFQKACRTVPFRGELLYSLMSVALGTELSQLANSPTLLCLLCLHCSLQGYDPHGFGVPYGGYFAGAKQEAFAHVCLQDGINFWPWGRATFKIFAASDLHPALLLESLDHVSNSTSDWTYSTLELILPTWKALGLMLQDVRDATDSQGTKALQKMSILVSALLALLARQVICRSPRASLSSGLRTEKFLDFAKPAIHSMHWGTRL